MTNIMDLDPIQAHNNDRGDLVQAIEDDIATNENCLRIKVGQGPRYQFQKIWVHGIKARTDRYDAKKHAPESPRLLAPTTEERRDISGPTSRYLVVGFILANEPGKYSSRNQGQLSGRRGQVKDMAILEAEENILRVAVRCSEHIAQSPKYYAICLDEGGIGYPLLVNGSEVFFFAEIWEGIPPNIPKKKRVPLISKACVEHAATSKSKKPVELRTPSKMSHAEPAAQRFWSLKMAYSIYQKARTPDSLTRLRDLAKAHWPELAKIPSEPGTKAFFDWNTSLSEEFAKSLVEEVVNRHPELNTLCFELVRKLHASLQRVDDESITSKGDSLPFSGLPIFLCIAAEKLDANATQEIVDRAIDTILCQTMRIWYITSPDRIQTTSHDCVDEFMMAIQDGIKDIQDSFEEWREREKNRYGMVGQYGDLDELMARLSNCCDITTMELYTDQLSAVIADHQLQGFRQFIEKLDDLSNFIQRFQAV